MALHPLRTAALGQNSTALLDLSRAVAANAVLAGHAIDIFGLHTRASAGQFGVGIFFILSGFLILQSSMARLGRPGPHFSSYMIDRFARIFTAYVPVLVLVAAVNAVLPLGRWGQPGLSTGVSAFLGNLLLLQDYPIFQAAYRLTGETLRIRSYNSAEPFWTIPIEFWTYVVFGLGFFGLAARERLAVVPAVVLGVVAFPVVIWNAAAGGGNGLVLVWLVGAVSAYVWVAAWHRSRHKLQIGAVVLLIASICWLGRGLKTGWDFEDLGLVLCEALILLGIISVAECARLLPQAFRRGCTFLASYSYTLYLVHNTILIVIRRFASVALGSFALPAALLAAHIVAFGLYLLFERHYRQVGRWLKRRFIVPSAVDAQA